MDQCVTGLRIISKNFRFDTIEDDILRDIIACGVHSKNVKETSQRQRTYSRKSIECMSCEFRVKELNERFTTGRTDQSSKV